MGQLAPSGRDVPQSEIWRQRYFTILTLLGWIAFAGVIVWFLGLIIQPVVYLVISAILGYILYPVVKLFQRFMPRPVAILLMLLLVAAVLFLLLYIVGVVVIQQLILLTGFIASLFRQPPPGAVRPVLDLLHTLGISTSQFQISGQQIIQYAQGFIRGIVPFIGSVISALLTILLVTSLSVYFLIDGGRVADWLKRCTPLRMRGQMTIFLNTASYTIGGFIRGQLLLAIIVSVLLGVGALLLQVPYAALIGVIVFVFEFIPIIGAYISGILSILLALTHSWQSALFMAILVFLVMQILEGQILSPRILGQSVGLHPIVAIFALLVGTRLFGLLGACLAAPVAGIIQSFLITFWLTWQKKHPDQFPPGETPSPPSEQTERTKGPRRFSEPAPE